MAARHNLESVKAMEWDKFMSLAKGRTLSAPGLALLSRLESPENWAPDVRTAQALQDETHEITPLLDRTALWDPLRELADPLAKLEQLRLGAVMQVKDLALMRGWFLAIDSWSQIPRSDIRGELLKKSLANITEPFEPLRILGRILTPEGELSENASARLALLHVEIRSLKREIVSVLDSCLKKFSDHGFLQEAYTDVRDGRYVVPVKISAQHEIDGIIHEASMSRQTVFVEPAEIAPLNNHLRQTENQLVQEIYKVLSETSESLRPFTGELEASVLILAHWDAVQAKARFGLTYSGNKIAVIDERGLILKETAHPLLWSSLPPDKIVRNDLELVGPNSTLLVTGPNTGGKTILLKTAGLAGMCARTGFPFPGAGQIIVPFFDQFFSDIGDPQSLSEHLSSFSGHILKLKEVLENVTNASLVLIDELNTATDPDEGAALARAFLETAALKGATIICTTHDPSLKAISATDARISCVSMAFDETTKLPTFRVIAGVPGRSRALETALRLGLPMAVIDLAHKYMSKEHAEFEKMLSRFEANIQETARAKKEALAAREEAERLKAEWLKLTESSLSPVLEKVQRKFRALLEQAQDEFRVIVRKGEKARPEIPPTRDRYAAKIESALSEEAPELAAKLEEAKAEKAQKQAAQASSESPLKAGASVRISKWKSTGTIIDVIEDKAKVAMGAMQMTLPLSDLEPLPASSSPAEGRAQKLQRKIDEEVPVPPSQIDMRGMRLEDALRELEHYLDQAFRCGALSEVTIIHGLGTGALREGARKLLSGLPYVKTYRDAGAGHGGTGATVVELERRS